MGRLCKKLPLWGMAMVAPAVWVTLEWLRGWLLTGFPWLTSGYAMIDTPLAGYGVIFGVYGVSFAAMLMVGVLVATVLGQRLRSLNWLLVMAMMPLGGWALLHIDWSEQAGRPFRVSLIQANIEQHYKWDERRFGQSMKRHLDLTAVSWQSDLIIWPETAVSAFEYSVQSFLLDPLEEEARKQGTELLMGTVPMDLKSNRYYNAVRNLAGEGGYYAKRHLVPFGEYAPFRAILKPFVDSLGVPMSDFAPGQSKRPLLKVLGYEAGMSICYEDVFGNEVIQALPEAAFLVNITNDGWFGDSYAPYQHLEMARMRALETSRYLLRSTNTGVSAVIDPKGRVMVRAAMFTEQALTAKVTPLRGATPYSRLGNGLILAVLLLTLVMGFGAAAVRLNRG
jgi:apolipoprotein N-acyltransferase